MVPRAERRVSQPLDQTVRVRHPLSTTCKVCQKETPMASIELSTEDAGLVAKVLEWRLSRLMSEIHHTDTRDFREDLKRQATRIEQILRRLEADQAPSHP
jgi:hypothetical protein